MKSALILLLLGALPAIAQQSTPPPVPPEDVASDVYALRELAREDRTVIDALVLYPEEVVLSVLDVARHPEIVVRLSRIQKTATASFRKIVSCATPAEQKMAWDIARYPGLAGDLIDTDRTSPSFRQILLKYPTAIHSAAMALGTRRESCDLIVNLYELQKGVDSAVLSLLNEYPEEIHEEAARLVAHPEILTLLGDYMDQTVLIGNIYRKNPEFVRKRALELRHEVEAKSVGAMEDWKAFLAANPAALGELTQAAAEFAAQTRRDPESRETGVFAAPPYSYWFGIPDGSSEWYSHPDYFLWGFYYDSDGALVLASMPSSEFVNWLDEKKYSQLAVAMVQQYRSHEQMSGAFYSAIHQRMEAIQEAPAKPASEAARRLAESIKLADPTEFNKEYQASDYWMSTTYQAIKNAGGLSGEKKY